MNQTQIKYASARAASILRARTEDLPRKFTTPGRKLSDPEIVAALKAGEFTVRDAKQESRYTYIRQYLDFGETEDVLDKEGLDAAKAALKASYDALMDKLMLGNAIEALALIAAFEKE